MWFLSVAPPGLCGLISLSLSLSLSVSLSLQAKQKELEGVVNPIMMKVYQAAGGGGMPEGGMPGADMGGAPGAARDVRRGGHLCFLMFFC